MGSVEEKGEGWGGRVAGGNQRRASKSLLPEESDRMHYIPPARIRNNKCGMSTREAHVRLRRKALAGGWSHRRTLPSTYQNCRLLEGKQAFIIKHIVCTNSLAIVSYHFVNGKNPPEI